MIRQVAAGVEIDVRVIPRAGKSGVAGERDGRLLVRLSTPPVEGAANQALIELFSTLLGRPKRDIRLLSGERRRAKRVALDGVSAEQVQGRLRA